MSLVTISDLETYLGKTITGGSDEAKYTFLISAIEDEANAITYRKLEQDTYSSELHDGNGGSELYLNNYPVTAVTEVKYGWVWSGSTRDEIASTDYLTYAEEGYLAFGFNSIQDGNQMFEVSYTAGYTNVTVPDDLKKALMDQIEASFNFQFTNDTVHTSGTIKKEKLGDYEYENFDTYEDTSKINSISNSISEMFKTKLRPYIKADLI